MTRKRALLIAAAALLVAVVVALALRPAAVPVQTGRAYRGPLQVVVEDQGKARVRQRYVIAAPVAGYLERIALQAGDAVEVGGVLARVAPAAAPLLNPRTRAELLAKVKAAEAGLRQSKAAAQQARVARDYAAKELRRLRNLFKQKAVARAELDQTERAARVAAEEVQGAEQAVRVAEYQLEMAQAALLQARGQSPAGDQVVVHSPIAGRVLRVVQESAGVVSAGQPLLELGNPARLEAVVDVLTSDAVRITPGDPVTLTQWGGGAALAGRVRRVEPSAFTKVSALGVEEQRVNVIINPAEPGGWAALSDGYRVEARIVVWQGEDVLGVPATALFRRGDSWAVFALRDGRAQLCPVVIGERGEARVQVSEGLAAGDVVILHPGDQVGDGVRVEVVAGPLSG